MKAIYFFLLIFLTGTLVAQNAWINEFHYDNASTDANEAVEVVIENAGLYDLNDFKVYLYNGSDSMIYNQAVVDAMTVGNVEGNFTFFYKIFPAGEVQNGVADAFCLSYQGSVISGQFLSYEGVIDGKDGPALGLTSVDVGVSESSSTLATESLQLSGNGNHYSDFTWQTPANATLGTLNNGQTMTTTTVLDKNIKQGFINPVTDFVTLVGESGSLVSIQNTAGVVVLNEKMLKDIQEFNTAKLPQGLYILSILKKDGTKTSVKFIKK